MLVGWIGHRISNMMTGPQKKRLIWVSFIDPVETLDAATWIETTRALNELDWDVTLIGNRREKFVNIQGVSIRCYSAPDIYFIRKLIYHLKIIRFILSQWGSIDIVMFHQISAPWILLLRLIPFYQLNKRPLFMMDTRDLPDLVDGNIRSRLHLQFYWVAHWLANRFADKQVAITPKMAQMVKIPPQKYVGSWPSGVDLETFGTLHHNRRWPRPGDPVQLIYIGSLVQKRNLVPLSQAVIKANEEGMKFKLLIIGTGTEQPLISPLAKLSEGAVDLLPPVPHQDIPLFLAKAHIGVTSLPLPFDKKYEASSPVKIFEYLAAGLPILATQNYCHTHVVGSGRYAFWIKEPIVPEIKAALCQIWKHRGTLSDLGQAALEDAQKWTWQQAAKKLNNALNLAIDGASVG